MLQSVPAETDEERIASRNEILALQRFRESVTERLNDLGRVGLVPVVDC